MAENESCLAPFSETKALKVKTTRKTSLDDKKVYACHFGNCTKRYAKPCLLEDHIRTHTNERPFACDYPGCGKRFYRLTHLQTHFRVHTNVKPFACTFEGCTSTFYTMQHLHRHEAAHRKPKVYACTWEGCTMSFSRHQQLRIHVAKEHTHTDPYPCPYEGCTQGFPTKVKLKSHVDRVHEKTVSYQCTHEECKGQPGFLKWSELQQHIRECHQLRNHYVVHETTLEERRVHKCTYEGCERAFTRLPALKNHVQVVHMGVRPFSCERCGKRFGYKQLWRRHCERKQCSVTSTVNSCEDGSISPDALSIPQLPVPSLKPTMNAMEKELLFSENSLQILDQQNIAAHAQEIVKTLTGFRYEDDRDICCVVPDCPYRFKRMYDLSRHVASMHPEVPLVDVSTSPDLYNAVMETSNDEQLDQQNPQSSPISTVLHV
ncbi:RNA polymerase III transcription factor tfiiia [Schizosaccharomyces japonicus yFS275]|uniref:RNA polymerase III transcription factor tfiiia n=1 Tax=Schizosaccharomyces japonicus (strain yFS275 / FY16936) TaxID=402676 RepID=B6JUW8_SCHJY|nr:RNA polymerase III transcription factor tfiiia [Schizosaccharomyces japonicus yFS275]EEB05072.2 RNA polymerase III transcription factor tfiiia [Schizosaccharomyces japonicus yFS275]